ncbi:MAG TPA: hypothetical protein VD932_02700 [Aquabacterium sp.]|nr:hypothetical protein [Aquabacterium sp.]
MKFACGITTVPSRADDLLPATVASLRAADFPAPRLFVDGRADARHEALSPDVTARGEPLGAFGNWLLALQELVIRHPDADLIALFQDDLEAAPGLRGYLERTLRPASCYWNLFTTGGADTHDPTDSWAGPGWNPSRRPGTGAVALIFPIETAILLLRQAWIHGQPRDGIRRKAFIDDCVRRCLQPLRVAELVHGPSLVQHKGALRSTVRSQLQLTASTFGETR